MNRALIATIIVFSSTLISYGQNKFGGGIMYGSYLEQPAIQVHGVFGFNPKFKVAPDFIYYFTDKVEILGNETKTRVWELNGNVQYYVLEKGIQGYLIGGLNFTRTVIDADMATRVVNGEFGLNLGAGVSFAKIIFTEFKYIFGNSEGFVAGAGVRIGI